MKNINLGFNDEKFVNFQNKITELSRNLQTYLNHREATIRAICSEGKTSMNPSQMRMVSNLESKIIIQYQKYQKFLENSCPAEGDLKVKYHLLAQQAISIPNGPKAEAFRNFLRSKIELWKSLHIISGLEIHVRPQLLKQATQILIKLCNDESKLNSNIPDFFQQLKLNYQQLEREHEQLLSPKEKEQKRSRSNKKREKIRE